MPRPLPAPDTLDGAFYRYMVERPDDPTPRLILADREEEQGLVRGEVRRSIETVRARLGRGLRLASLDHLEHLRGSTLTEAESAQVAARIHVLLVDSPAGQEPLQASTERELSATLGAPQRGDTMLQLLDDANKLDTRRLREQYEFQTALLASLDLLEEQKVELGITAIDHRFHPLPPLREIEERLQSPALRRKVEQGFNQLLLVPFGLPLMRLLDAWRQDLRRNEHLLQPYGGLDRAKPLWMWEAYKWEDLIYFPQRFAEDHGGRTKAQVLAADPSKAWQILLTEGALHDLPRRGKGQTIGYRRQIEATGHASRHYLANCPLEEVGLTPEAYVTAFCNALERTGQVLDRRTGSHLLAAYLPASGDVPHVYWGSRGRRVRLSGRYHSVGCSPHVGARTAVQVL